MSDKPRPQYTRVSLTAHHRYPSPKPHDRGHTDHIHPSRLFAFTKAPAQRGSLYDLYRMSDTTFREMLFMLTYYT